MFGNLSYNDLFILGYTLLSLSINTNTFVERYRKRHSVQTKSPTGFKLNIPLFIVAIIGILSTRGIVFLFAIIMLSNPILKTISLVLLVGDILFFVVFGFDKDGNAVTLSRSENHLRTVFLLCESGFIFYFLIFFLLKSIS